MRLFGHHFLRNHLLRILFLRILFLRIWVTLLTAVFITNTVYAGSMMVSASFSSMHGEPVQITQTGLAVAHVNAQHCHDQAGDGHQHDADAHSDSHSSMHQPAPKSVSQTTSSSQAHHSGSHCNHCMACFSMMVYDQPVMAAVSGQPVLAIASGVLYLAPTNPQPSKPPIA